MNFSEIKIAIKNYRCFSDSQFLEFQVKPGFTSFLGPNNSGKTSALKFFYEMRRVFSLLSLDDISFHKKGDDELTYLYEYFPPQRGRNKEEKKKTFDLAESIFCTKNDRSLEFSLEIHFSQDTSTGSLGRAEVNIVIPRDRKNYLEISIHKLERLEPIDPNKKDEINTHIRNVFSLLSEMFYIGSFRNALSVQSIYFDKREGGSQISDNQRYFDIRFGHDFYSLWSELKYGSSKSGHKLAYQITESVKTIFNFKSFEINTSSNEYTLLLTVNGDTYKLDEMGSGIAQVLLVFINSAISKPPFILIDEPELGLHPSLQLDFLTSLASFARMGIIFSTHSLGLARSSSDRIYSVFRNAEDDSLISEFEATESLPEFFGELNFSSSHNNFGFTKILLVEGVTEIKTIQQFLRKLKKDKDFLLIPLGGSQLIRDSIEIELIELKRITGSIFSLVDSERSSEVEELDKNRTGFLEICNKIGIKCHILQKRATENYFSDRSIKAIKGGKYRALEPYEKLKSVEFAWSKSENWRIAREMNLSEFENTDLGHFLSSI